MGERMKSTVAAAYTAYQCRAHDDELKQATLFSRTEGVLARTFAAIATRPCPELVKKKVLVIPGGGGVALLHGNEQIAWVAAGDAGWLAQAIAADPLCAGMAVAVIEEASSITPELVLRLIDHSKDDGEDDDE